MWIFDFQKAAKNDVLDQNANVTIKQQNLQEAGNLEIVQMSTVLWVYYIPGLPQSMPNADQCQSNFWKLSWNTCQQQSMSIHSIHLRRIELALIYIRIIRAILIGIDRHWLLIKGVMIVYSVVETARVSRVTLISCIYWIKGTHICF